MVLKVGDFYRRRHSKSSGTITWTSGTGRLSSIVFSTSWEAGTIITLHYRWQDREEIRIPIRIQYTPARFGGERSWFTCPLSTRGVACNRRVGKLYLPPGGKYFGCRQCHALTYRSCQEAHQTERLFASMERIGNLESRLAAMMSRQR